MPLKNSVDRPLQVSNTFAMDDADIADPFFEAGLKIIRDEVFYLPGIERVQIQNAVYRQVHRLIHA